MGEDIERQGLVTKELVIGVSNVALRRSLVSWMRPPGL